MIKKLIFFAFVLFTLFFPNQVNAFDPFIKSPSNPLPFNNTFLNWNESGMYQPSTLFENGIYKMWYASYNGSGFKIIYSTSADGISWTRQNLLDLYPGFDNHDPAILKTVNGYTLFFVASTGGGSQNFKIYKINSTDSINFDQNSRQLVLQPTGVLESNGVTSPYVVLENGNYYIFYQCWGNQGFRVCMATSPDGNQWTRCPNNPIITELSDGPSILKKDGKYFLFFQSSLGIRQAESTDVLACNMGWSNFQTVLPDPIVGPTILENQNILSLYYSGFTQSGLKIFLATSGVQSSPTPSLTSVPTLTPTPVPNKKKIIIIPGTFASWNRSAMLHNRQVSQSQWKLLKFVKEYDGLINTLENLQYAKDDDFYIFTYDWRKKLNDLADDLNQFIIANNLGNSQLNLVGHSLGRLVARIYGQKYGTDFIDKIVTIGSPHLGTANTYKVVEAGELEKNNSSLWLMQKLILQINRKNFSSDKDTVLLRMPIFKDLFPIYDFLVDTEDNLIFIQDMKIKNTNLLTYAYQFPNIFPQLSTIAGEKGNNTLSGHKVEARSTLDILLDNYPDGRPVDNRLDLGDNLIIKNSAQAGNDVVSLAADHGEIVYKKQSIHTILSKLEIPHNQDQIIEGKGTKISPSLIFALLSPATLQVNFNSDEFDEDEGLIFIEDAEPGNYELNVKGNYPGGRYTVLVGQISNTKDKWFEINGEINNLLPFLQTDTFTITFDPSDLLDFAANQNSIPSLFDLLVQRLIFIESNYHPDLQKVIEKTKLAKKEYIKNNYNSSLNQILEIQNEIFKARRNIPIEAANMLFDTLIQVENLYEKVAEEGNIESKPADLSKKLNYLKKEYTKLEIFLLNQKNKNIDVQEEATSLSRMNDKLQKAEEELTKNNLPLTDILLLSAERLGKEIK